MSSRRGFVLAGLATAATAVPALSAQAQTALPPDRVTVLAPDAAAGDQTIRIQEAIDRIEAAGGGALILSPGTYRCQSAPIRIDPTKTSLLSFGGLLDFSGTSADGLQNGAILVQVKPGSTQYGHATQKIEGVRLTGRRGGGSIGILFKTETEVLSSRMSLYNVDITNFDFGVQFADRTYIIKMYSCDIYQCGTCVFFKGNSPDAGENLSFYGCTFFNSTLAVENQQGAGLVFVACSFDYCDKFYMGGGAIDFVGCHFEANGPKSEAPMFEVTGSSALRLQGGNMLISGVDFQPVPRNRSMFHIEHKLGRVFLDGTTLWNVRSGTGALASGNGRLVTRHLTGIGNRAVSGVPLRNDKHDLFGGMGRFEGDTVRLACEIQPEAPREPADLLRSAFGTARIVANGGQSGRNALAITKTGGKGNALVAKFYAPVRDDIHIAFETGLRSLNAPNQLPWTLWIRFAAVQMLGATTRYRTGALEFIGPLLTLRSDELAAWRQVNANSIHLDEGPGLDNQIARWATHIMVEVNIIDAPQGTVLSFDNMQLYAT